MLDYKDIIIKSYALDMSGAEIARQLGCSKSVESMTSLTHEYVQAEKNNNVKRSIAEQEQQRVEQVECSSSKNKDIKVIVVFPTTSDSKAETEFISRLKEIYLKKIETGAMQEETQALYYNPISKGKQLKHTKEGNSHE